MHKFVFNDNKSLYHNWFRLYSHLLFPSSKRKREKAFSFYYYRFASQHKNISEYDFEKISYRSIATKFDALLGDQRFLEENDERNKTIIAAGVLGRLYYSLDYHGFTETSQKKVMNLYNYRFSDKAEEGKRKGRYGVAYAYECLKLHRSYLPYCVAWSRCRKLKSESCEGFRDWLISYFSTAEAYKDACKKIKQARKAAWADSFIDLEKTLNVEWWHDLDTISCSLLKPYRLGFLAMYAVRAGIRNDALYTIL